MRKNRTKQLKKKGNKQKKDDLATKMLKKLN